MIQGGRRYRLYQHHNKWWLCHGDINTGNIKGLVLGSKAAPITTTTHSRVEPTGTGWLTSCCRGQGEDTGPWEEEKMGVERLGMGGRRERGYKENGWGLDMWGTPKSQV